MEPIRPRSRRGEPRKYFTERLSAELAPIRTRESPVPVASTLAAAGAMTSTLKRKLREQNIDPRMARLVLAFYNGSEVRVREVAWYLGVSPSTASRYLDQGEELGLIDKFYDTVLDRRATAGQLTERGRLLRRQVEAILEANAPHAPRHFGRAYGRRVVGSNPDD